MVTEPVAARRALMRVRNHGMGIAIDDFGAGFTSLTQLKDLPVTELKIDASFVRAMEVDSGAGIIVRSVIDLGH